jgi:chaperonin GroES
MGTSFQYLHTKNKHTQPRHLSCKEKEHMKTVKPSPTHLFCKPDEAETETASGFLLAAAAEKPKTAHVINVGSNVSTYHPKETIIYKSYATTELKLEGEEYFLIAEEDVLGVVIDAK